MQNDSHVAADELEVGTQVPDADQSELSDFSLKGINFKNYIVFN